MKSRTKSKGKKLRKAKNAVRGAFNKPRAPYLEHIQRYGHAKLSPVDLIVGGISQLGPEDANEFSEWLKGFPSKMVQVFPNHPIRKPIDLRLESVMIEMPLLTRSNWLSTLLHAAKDDLAIFVCAAGQIELLFLSGQYEKTQGLLDEIKERFGLSIWWIEIQTALLQRWKGLDSQKEFARSITTNTRGKLAGVTAYWVSQRNEDRVGPGNLHRTVGGVSA